MKKCCVLIPYFNAGRSLLDSIQSIDSDVIQPDVIVVDDGSDKLKAIDVIREYSGNLKVYLLVLDKNQGIEGALNAGLELYSRQYEYIARLDCGDLCKNGRIGKQVSHLDHNLELALVGGWIDFIDMEGRYLFTLRNPLSYESIKSKMPINSMIAHVSVMFRSSVFEVVGHYPVNAPAAEDYALFFKIIKKYPVQNIGEIFVDCTVDPNGISSKKRKTQIRSRINIMLQNFALTPYSVYGLLRSLILLHTPRGFTVYLNKVKGRLFYFSERS